MNSYMKEIIISIDYTDHWFIGEKGTEVKIAGVYGHYVYVICGAQVGWVNEEDIDY